MHSAADLRELFLEELNRIRIDSEPRNLYEPFTYMLSLGGKRIRPVSLLMASEMFGTDATHAMPQAIAVELFHNFTLIHDDIMDRAPLRRGQPTVHEKFGQTVAILSGDAMLVYAYQYLIHTSSAPIQKLVSVFNECAIKVCEGQQMDMNFETDINTTVEDYKTMIELKTAALLATSLQLGALVGGASEKDAQHLYNFGKELGIAFQLKDDWLDAYGDMAKTGKQPGGDIIQNKKTFLYLEALRLADEKTAISLREYFNNQEVNPSEKIKSVLRIFTETKAEQRTLQLIDEHYESALIEFNKISVGDSQKEPLGKLAASLMLRNY